MTFRVCLLLFRLTSYDALNDPKPYHTVCGDVSVKDVREIAKDCDIHDAHPDHMCHMVRKGRNVRFYFVDWATND